MHASESRNLHQQKKIRGCLLDAWSENMCAGMETENKWTREQPFTHPLTYGWKKCTQRRHALAPSNQRTPPTSNPRLKRPSKGLNLRLPRLCGLKNSSQNIPRAQSRWENGTSANPKANSPIQTRRLAVATVAAALVLHVPLNFTFALAWKVTEIQYHWLLKPSRSCVVLCESRQVCVAVSME